MVRDGWAVAFERYSRDYVDQEAEARGPSRYVVWHVSNAVGVAVGTSRAIETRVPVLKTTEERP